jgi:glucuronokinase
MTIYAKSYPRIGLIGNPSDGFFGKTISLTFSNFHARVVLQESAELELLPSPQDHSRFKSLEHLTRDVRLHGYYGGIRLLKATVKRFHDYCLECGVTLHKENFTLSYQSTIPHGVGLSGSSAIITATTRALMEFYGVKIEKPLLANLVLSAEQQELGITAGLQDRVIQAYEGVVYMDFNRELMETQGYGRYERLDHKLLPNLYMAYREDLAGESGKIHSNFRQRFQQGDPEALAAVRFWMDITDQFREAMKSGDIRKMGELLNANFDMRRKVFNIDPSSLEMVETARSVGASAKFTGSGGAIVGIYEDERMFDVLVATLGKIRVKVIKPVIKLPEEES